MILLQIASKSELKIEEIAEMLLSHRFVIDVNVHRNVERAELVNDKLVYGTICTLSAKTRAVLFDAIDQKLREMYPDNMPETYALPIMQMDWKQANILTKDVQEVKAVNNRLKRVINKVRGRKM